MTHQTQTRAPRIASSMLYRVCYRASLLHQKSHAYGAGYVMQISKCICLQIMCYCKRVLRSKHTVILCKEPQEMPLVFISTESYSKNVEFCRNVGRLRYFQLVRVGLVIQATDQLVNLEIYTLLTMQKLLMVLKIGFSFVCKIFPLNTARTIFLCDSLVYKNVFCTMAINWILLVEVPASGVLCGGP